MIGIINPLLQMLIILKLDSSIQDLLYLLYFPKKRKKPREDLRNNNRNLSFHNT
jgi:hypothetical protein